MFFKFCSVYHILETFEQKVDYTLKKEHPWKLTSGYFGQSSRLLGYLPARLTGSKIMHSIPRLSNHLNHDSLSYSLFMKQYIRAWEKIDSCGSYRGGRKSRLYPDVYLKRQFMPHFRQRRRPHFIASLTCCLWQTTYTGYFTESNLCPPLWPSFCSLNYYKVIADHLVNLSTYRIGWQMMFLIVQDITR